MDITENPFYILGASPRDNRVKLKTSADDKSLIVDPNICSQAFSTLTNPRKRLSAEMAWFPGVVPKRVTELINLLNTHELKDLTDIDNLPPIAKANFIASSLPKLQTLTHYKLADWILKLAYVFDDIKPEKLLSLINEERIVSGFPEVNDLTVINAEIQERRQYYRQAIKIALDNYPSRDIIKTITITVETATDKGHKHGPVLLDDFIDNYEIEVQTFLDKEHSNIEQLVKKIKDIADAKGSDQTIENMINQLAQIVENWDAVAQPIQVSTKSRGLTHKASHDVADLIRDLSLHLFNKHNKLDFSKKLTELQKKVFEEVIKVAELADEDAVKLEEITNRTTTSKKEDLAWQSEITYETELGLIFKKKLKISPNGIEWRNQIYPLETIKKVRWSGITHYRNGINMGTTYKIEFDGDSGYCEIKIKNECIYHSFIDKLWKAVCIRIFIKILTELKEGKNLEFPVALIDDGGITLLRSKFFKSDEQIYHRWDEVNIWSQSGSFFIASSKNKNLKTSCSYQDYWNGHIIEAIIRRALEKGYNRLSSLLS